MLTLPPEVEAAFRQHALEDFPREVCGLHTRAGGYVRMRNASKNPENAFSMEPRQFARVAANDDVLGVLHSHTHWQDAPSHADMLMQHSLGLPSYILVCGESNGTPVLREVFSHGDHTLDDPLEGMPFRHGVHDCYALVRRWWWQNRGLVLPDYPRDNEWWRQGGDLFSPENLKKAGFDYVEVSDAQEGDVLLMRIGPCVNANHAAVVLQGGRILHHLTDRLSRVDPLHPYLRHTRACVRRHHV